MLDACGVDSRDRPLRVQPQPGLGRTRGLLENFKNRCDSGKGTDQGTDFGDGWGKLLGEENLTN